jgi:hypothetical protein
MHTITQVDLNLCAVNISRIKILFTVPTVAHYYEIVEMLKQFKKYDICSDMFRFTQEASSGSSPVLSENYSYGFTVLVGIDAAQDCSLMMVSA